MNYIQWIRRYLALNKVQLFQNPLISLFINYLQQLIMTTGELRYYTGGKLAMENAQRLVDLSILAADKKSFGAGNSLLVLGAEEAVKGYLCIHKYYRPLEEIPDFDQIFADHRVKHTHISKLLSSMKLVLEQSQQALRYVDDNLGKLIELFTHESGIAPTSEQSEQLKQLIFLMRAVAHNPLKYSADELSKWWKQAEDIKQKGFYVDRNGKGWHDPGKANPSFNKKAREIVDMVLLYTGIFMSLETLALMGILVRPHSYP
jgi:AbiV family abortive infection protein